MKIKIIHIYGFSEKHQKVFSAAFKERDVRLLKDEKELKASIGDIEVLFVFRPPRKVWAGAKKLRLIQTVGAGVDAVLPAPDLPSGVRIANAQGVGGEPMAEYALLIMLAFAKKLPWMLENQRSRHWERHVASSLRSKTCSIVGLGAIGQVVAARAKQFGMRVLGIQRDPKQCAYADEILAPDHIDRVLEEADFVVVLLPLTPQTSNMMSRQVLSHLRPDAVLINMARGGIVDENAVADMLREGRLGGAAFDVFSEEPLPESSELWSAPNFLITPHVAGGVTDYMDRVLKIFVDNVRRLEEEEPLINEIDKERGY